MNELSLKINDADVLNKIMKTITTQCSTSERNEIPASVVTSPAQATSTITSIISNNTHPSQHHHHIQPKMEQKSQIHHLPLPHQHPAHQLHHHISAGPPPPPPSMHLPPPNPQLAALALHHQVQQHQQQQQQQQQQQPQSSPSTVRTQPSPRTSHPPPPHPQQQQPQQQPPPESHQQQGPVPAGPLPPQHHTVPVTIITHAGSINPANMPVVDGGPANGRVGAIQMHHLAAAQQSAEEHSVVY
uniref:Uncharacterized protein n=1 Tax=Anopheles melas TaxID=34690 RepID=A0A182U546_9DIPT